MWIVWTLCNCSSMLYTLNFVQTSWTSQWWSILQNRYLCEEHTMTWDTEMSPSEKSHYWMYVVHSKVQSSKCWKSLYRKKWWESTRVTGVTVSCHRVSVTGRWSKLSSTFLIFDSYYIAEGRTNRSATSIIAVCEFFLSRILDICDTMTIG